MRAAFRTRSVTLPIAPRWSNPWPARMSTDRATTLPAASLTMSRARQLKSCRAVTMPSLTSAAPARASSAPALEVRPARVRFSSAASVRPAPSVAVARRPREAMRRACTRRAWALCSTPLFSRSPASVSVPAAVLDSVPALARRAAAMSWPWASMKPAGWLTIDSSAPPRRRSAPRAASSEPAFSTRCWTERSSAGVPVSGPLAVIAAWLDRSCVATRSAAALSSIRFSSVPSTVASSVPCVAM
ncbi:Uncharacterised protein [Bordetella pertussis]|nr:Uncharacterised protein [Bordetella pertussis]CFL81259.1 Uncharacterised protein [Bordetella pertussis]CFL90646.1 Uncharacterised protein [Bordetella pertussis]CFL99609.1 Uncharacterised protein [Bordetella pertussis]CFM26445.1 Uncharacterised protein [Bordetella pertussis]